MDDLKFYYNNENVNEKTELYCNKLIQQAKRNEQVEINLDVDLDKLIEMTFLHDEMMLKKNDNVTIRDTSKDISVRAKVKEVVGNEYTLTIVD